MNKSLVQPFFPNIQHPHIGPKVGMGGILSRPAANAALMIITLAMLLTFHDGKTRIQANEISHLQWPHRHVASIFHH